MSQCVSIVAVATEIVVALIWIVEWSVKWYYSQFFVVIFHGINSIIQELESMTQKKIEERRNYSLPRNINILQNWNVHFQLTKINVVFIKMQMIFDIIISYNIFFFMHTKHYPNYYECFFKKLWFTHEHACDIVVVFFILWLFFTFIEAKTKKKVFYFNVQFDKQSFK